MEGLFDNPPVVACVLYHLPTEDALELRCLSRRMKQRIDAQNTWWTGLFGDPAPVTTRRAYQKFVDTMKYTVARKRRSRDKTKGYIQRRKNKLHKTLYEEAHYARLVEKHPFPTQSNKGKLKRRRRNIETLRKELILLEGELEEEQEYLDEIVLIRDQAKKWLKKM